MMSVIFTETNERYTCHGIGRSLKWIGTTLWLKVSNSIGMAALHFYCVVTSKRKVDLMRAVLRQISNDVSNALHSNSSHF